MFEDVIAHYSGQTPQTIISLMKTSPDDIYSSTTYKGMVTDVDLNTLHRTTTETRAYMDSHLPELVKKYKAKYGLEEFPLDGRMLCNWVVAFANMSYTLSQLLDIHVNVPKDIMRDVLPDVLTMLDDAPEPHAWQKAIAIFVIPMVTHKHSTQTRS